MKPPIKNVPAELNRRLDDLEKKVTGEQIIETVTSTTTETTTASPTIIVEDNGKDSVSLSATPSSENLYEFAIREGSAGGWNTRVTTSNQATFISLKSHTKYEARVRVLNMGGGSGNWSNITTVITRRDHTPPPVPENLSLAADSFYIRAKVDAIDLDEWADFAGFEFHASIESGFTPNDDTLKQVGITNRVTFHVTEAGQTWYVKVRSYDENGNYSDYCDQVSVLVPNTKVTPAPSDPTEEGEINIVEGSIELDDCDVLGNWTSEQAEAIRVTAAAPEDVSEGTGALKVEFDKYSRKLNQDEDNSAFTIGNTPSRKFGGQRFEAPWTGNLKRASIKMAPFGSPSAMTLYIYSDSGGDPNASLGSVVIAEPDDGQWYNGDFGAAIALTNGTPYWIIVDSVIDVYKFWVVRTSTLNPYKGTDYCFGYGNTYQCLNRLTDRDMDFRLFDDTNATGKHLKIASLGSKDLSNVDTVECDVKTSPGPMSGIIKLSMGEAALGEQLHTLTGMGYTYKTMVWDISGIAPTSRDGITEFGVELDTPDDYTIKMHFDNFRAVGQKKVRVKTSDSILQLFPQVIDRGDPSAFDWTHATLTTDGNWHDLDCSSIVPEGARFIVFRVTVEDNIVGAYLQLRKNGNTDVYNAIPVRVPYFDGYGDDQRIVACDVDRVVEYQASNLTFTSIGLVVVGWIF